MVARLPPAPFRERQIFSEISLTPGFNAVYEVPLTKPFKRFREGIDATAPG
jgi:hypothetical protein